MSLNDGSTVTTVTVVHLVHGIFSIMQHWHLWGEGAGLARGYRRLQTSYSVKKKQSAVRKLKATRNIV